MSDSPTKLKEDEDKSENNNNLLISNDFGNNIHFMENEDEEEKNNIYIQDLIKEGRYSDVIKFLESNDRDNKMKLDNKDNNNAEDEELVIIPADDISDLHEKSKDNISNKDDEDKNNLSIKFNKIEINEKEEAEKGKVEKVENKGDDILINQNDKNNIEKSNLINNKTKENEIINNDNKNSLMNNFIEVNEKKDNNNNNNESNPKNIITINENTDIKSDKKIISTNVVSEPEKNIETQNLLVNDNIKKEEIKPSDLIKNLKSNNEKKEKRKNSDLSNSSQNIDSLLDISLEEYKDNNIYYEEKLKDIQEQRKIIGEIESPEQKINNFEMLKKELEELKALENNETENLNGIEQMNEMYIMVQEDKLSSLLQEKTREKIFPFYNKANFDIKDNIQNNFFKSFNSNRNFSISSKILDKKNFKKRTNKDYNFDYPKSIFDFLKFEKNDIKSGLDLDEFLDEFLEHKKKDNKIMANNNSLVEKLFLKYKKKSTENQKLLTNKNKTNNIKTIKIDLNKKKSINNNTNTIKFDINIDSIYNKLKEKDSQKGVKKYDLKQYNNFFVDNFNKKNENYNFNDFSIDLDLDDDIKKELSKNNNNSNEDKDKDNFYLKINNNKAFNDSLLSNCTSLRFINLENDNLKKFPDFSKCPMIYNINLNNNEIEIIDKISSLQYLEKLSLTNNNIRVIENCSNNKRLRFLFLGHNKISNIDNISNEVPFIEELILCQNSISCLPDKIYLPFLKFCDLNENKIKVNIDNKLYFVCPSLEKLLLLGNNLNEYGTQSLIKFCPRLKEIDLSFNKYNSIFDLVKLLSVNSQLNDNLEMINVVGNTFFNSNKNKEIFYLLIKRFCPSIKFINNEEIKKNKSSIETHSIYKININSEIVNCNFDESYINIYNSQNLYLKYFTSVYFTNKIFNVFNININNNLKSSNTELFLLINEAYYNFKLSHFIAQKYITQDKIGFFAYDCSFQLDELLIYLYKFKNRMNYITYSIPILVKRTWFRRMKIIKIQQHYKLRILRKKLAAIIIPVDGDDHAEDLLEFFSKEGINKENEKKEKMIDEDLDNKIREIQKNIEKNIKDKENQEKIKSLEVIKESDKENDEYKNIANDLINISKNINLNKPDFFNNDKKFSNLNDFNNNNFIQNEIKNKNDNKVIKLFSEQKYNQGGSKLTPIRLTPIIKNPQNNNTNYLQNNNNTNIDVLKRNLGVFPNNTHNNNSKNKRIILKDDSNFGKLYDINSKINFPINQNSNKNPNNVGMKRPESNGVFLPIIGKNNGNFNVSTTTFSNDAKSVQSNYTTGKKLTKPIVNNKAYYGKQEQVMMIQKQCKKAIEQAKAEWGFTNNEAVFFLVKKIKKEYQAKINKLLKSG